MPLLLLACAEEAAEPGAGALQPAAGEPVHQEPQPDPDPTPLSRVLPKRADDPLLAYRWNQLAEIPSVFAAGEIILDYGEPAPAPDSLLHLSFNEGSGSRVHDVSPAGRVSEVPDASWVRGRFGDALAARPESAGPLVVRGDEPFFGDLWTLELWLRPDALPAAPQIILSESGSLAVHMLRDGRIGAALHVGEDVVLLQSASPLLTGEWNHVALAGDAHEYHHLRLVVNGSTSFRRLPESAVGPGSGVIEVGGGGPGESPFPGAIDQLSIVSRAIPTRELITRWETAAPPGEQVLHLRYQSGPREESLWVSPHRRALIETRDAWTRGDLRRVVADDAGIRWVPGNWERSRARVAPTPRTTHPTVFVGDHLAFLFGGEVRDSHFPPMRNTNDTWLYDIEAQRWSRDTFPLAPPPRCHQDFAYSPDHDLVLLVGGWRNDTAEKHLFSDVWVYHVAERRWEERPPVGAGFRSLSDSGVVYHAGARRFLLFRQHRIYEYDPDANLWSERPQPEVVDEAGRADRISGRVSPIMGYDPRTRLIVRFGGALVARGERIYTDTTALYDYDENRWTRLKPNPAPPPRVRAGFAYDTRLERFVLFGGVRDQFSLRYGDLWTFDTTSGRWEEIETSNTPSARGGYYGMAYDPELDVFVLAAGRPTHAELSNETWHLHLDPGAPGTATYVFDRAAFPGASQWFDSSIRPAGSRVAFRFAGSEDAIGWGEWVSEPAALQPPSARYVKVEVELAPGEGGAAPRVLSMGFLSDPQSGASALGRRMLPIAPFHAAAGDGER